MAFYGHERRCEFCEKIFIFKRALGRSVKDQIKFAYTCPKCQASPPVATDTVDSKYGIGRGAGGSIRRISR